MTVLELNQPSPQRRCGRVTVNHEPSEQASKQATSQPNQPTIISKLRDSVLEKPLGHQPVTVVPGLAMRAKFTGICLALAAGTAVTGLTGSGTTRVVVHIGATWFLLYFHNKSK